MKHGCGHIADAHVSHVIANHVRGTPTVSWGKRSSQGVKRVVPRIFAYICMCIYIYLYIGQSGGRRTADSGWTPDGAWRTADGGWRTADGGWQAVDGWLTPDG